MSYNILHLLTEDATGSLPYADRQELSGKFWLAGQMVADCKLEGQLDQEPRPLRLKKCAT
jgi:hypothetical protein